jgi:hypothetical protein
MATQVGSAERQAVLVEDAQIRPMGASAPTDPGRAARGLRFSKGGAPAVEEAQPGTRFMLMAGKPYGETPAYNRELA